MKSARYVIFVLGFALISSCGIFNKKTSSSASKKSKPDITIHSSILEKYSKIIGVAVTNESLYNFVDQWIGVPYKYGGKTKSGVDCSNFTCELLKTTFSFPSNFYFPSSKLAEQGKKIDLNAAKEGDMVFFSINQSSKISHVGVYLANNKFIHASTSKGVIINSLNEEYYKKRFVFIRRL